MGWPGSSRVVRLVSASLRLDHHEEVDGFLGRGRDARRGAAGRVEPGAARGARGLPGAGLRRARGTRDAAPRGSRLPAARGTRH